MKVLLISPPVSNIGQAAPSVSVLAAWLRSCGHDCRQWDLGIEAFHYFHSGSYLERAVGKAGDLSTRIDEAKAQLQRPGIESDLAEMSQSLQTIRDAGSLISSAHGLSRLNYSRFEIQGAFASWDSLAEAVRDGERNLLLAYYRRQALPQIEKLSPHLLGISVSYHSQLLPAFSLAYAVKQDFPDLPVLLGGSFVKSIQDDLRQMPASVVPADGICIGDGEPALQHYLEALSTDIEPRDVPNLLLPRDGSFAFSGKWQQTPLDQAPVPMMQMDGLDFGSYLVPRYAIPLPLARGCHWHKCVYCNISNQARENYRCRNIDLCTSDIKALIAQGNTDWFDFPTDSVLPKDLQRLAQALIDEGVNIRWAAEVLPDRRLSDDLIALLAKSGCCCLRFGLESACPRTLERMDKKTVDPDQASRILAACRRHGIKTGLMLIVGFPTETQAELMQTVEYLQQNAANIDFLTLHQFTLAPGSRLAAQPELAGLHLLPRQGVLTPSLPYDHTNPVAMRPADLPGVIDSLIDALADHHPQCGQLWASGIGGWLTFAASCSNSPRFFKQPL